MTRPRTPAHLSVNVNKVATLRNSRGGTRPSPAEAARACVAAGAQGITVHPRADARHITFADVLEIASAMRAEEWGVELNIEGDPREDLLALAMRIRPDQFTLVPVKPGEITSQAGWDPSVSPEGMARTVRALQQAGIRVSTFVDPEPAAVQWAAAAGSDRIELYTEPFARAFAAGDGAASFEQYASMASLAHELGLGVNAGHDLDLENLVLFRNCPWLDEVSIGHALVSHALYVGLDRAVRDYLAVLAGA